MTKYEELTQVVFDEGINLHEKVNFRNDTADEEHYVLGICCGNKIGLAKELQTENDRAAILAEEYAHWLISNGNILDQTDIRNRKQELSARLKSYDILFNGINGIVDGIKAGCHNLYELSEYLSVPEKTLQEALIAYRNKFGERIEFESFDLQLIPWVDIMSKRP